MKEQGGEGTRKAAQGDTVLIHYTGRLKSGEVFDTSEGRDPFRFTIGKEEVIPGFERAVVGLAAGESRTTSIPPEEAYGSKQPDLVLDLPRDAVQEEVEAGDAVTMRTPDGEEIDARIVSTDGDSVRIDLNHPLAGETLEFEVKLVSIA